MIDKVQKIREEVEKLKSNLMYGACSSQVAMETRCKEEAYNEILAILDTMQEEPVNRTPADVESAMQEVEEKSRVFTEAHKGEDADTILAQMRGEEPVSEDLEEAANNALSNVLNTHEIVNVRSCLEMFRLGAKWQKEQMLAKAIDVEVKVDAGGYPYIPQMELYDYDNDIPLANEGDKYKVVLIKEKIWEQQKRIYIRNIKSG